jgi:Carboxypeptidase regulatory-like domain
MKSAFAAIGDPRSSALRAKEQSSAMVNISKMLLLSALVVALCSLPSWAQSGSISGVVTDSSGAVVQGALVEVQNVETNQLRSAVSSGTGVYTVTELPVGFYDLKVQQTGFKTFRLTHIQVSVAQVATVNASLLPGTVSEQLEVRADQAPAVDLETSQISNLVDQRKIQDLPLMTRNPYELVLLSPGTSQTNTSLGGYTVNGSRERNNNFLLDGVDNNDTSVPGIVGGVLNANPDSTEEFRVITNNFNAEFGRNTGAIVDVVTKSGTNSFHGNAYEYGRWNSFGGARDWFNPRVDSAGQLQKMNPYVRNQFGYSIGGPIIKNKTFFFFNNEFQRFRTTLTNTATVPTAAFKTGVFNYTAPNNNTGQIETIPIDLTQTGANNAACSSPTTCAPIDPTMQKIFTLLPNPAQSGDGLSGTISFPSGSQQNSYQTVAKIDHRFTDRESVSLRYGYNHFFDPNPFHLDILPGNVGGVSSKNITDGLSAQLTSTLTNTLINNFVFGWNHIYATFDCTGINVLDSVSPLDRFGYGRDYFMDPFTSFGCLALVANNQFRTTGTVSYSDSLSWVKGGHTLKFGADFRTIGESGPNNFFSRRFVDTETFSEFQVGLIHPPSNDSVALEDAASAFYGFVGNDFNAEFFNKNAVRQSTDSKHFRQHEYDWFAQDTWKIRRNFTLTLGLRYQLDGVPYEENANFSNLLTNPASFPVMFTIVGPNTGQSIYKQDYSNIEPRVGFSWDPRGDGKMAIRSAFGIFHDRVFGNLFGNARGNPPFEQDHQQFPFETINDFFGSGAFPAVVPDTTPSATVLDGSAIRPIIFDTHFRNNASNNWSFGIQRQMSSSDVLDLSYVGSKGTHIYRQVDGNPPDPALVQQLIAFCVPTNPANTVGCTRSTIQNTNLYFGAELGSLPFDAVAHNALFQPFYQRSVGNSIYNSLQVKFTHRLSHGFHLQGAYSWAHGIDDSSDPLAPAAGLNICGNCTFPRNSRDLALERSNSDNDIRHTGVISYIWEVPFGKGKSYLNHGALGRVFEGWQFSGITTLQTGHPFTVRSAQDSLGTGVPNWAQLTGDPFALGSNDDFAHNQGLKVFFHNPGAFADPSFGSGPNINRNHFYGPNFINFDLAFTKRMSITEHVGAELRVESYNIFNRPHFNNPGSDAVNLTNLVGSGELGLITNTITRPDVTTSARQMQVALRVTF